MRIRRNPWSSKIAAALALIAGLSLCAAAQADLIYHMTFEQSLANSGTAGGDATLDGQVSATYSTNTSDQVAGDYSYDFPPKFTSGNGDGPSLVLPDSADAFRLDGNGEAMTIATWVYWNGDAVTQANPHQGIVSTMSSSTGNGWYLALSQAGVLRYRYIRSGGGNDDNSSGVTIPVGVWTHVAVTHTTGAGTPVRFYVNGEFVADSGTRTLANSLVETSTGAIELGTRYYDNGTGPLNGLLDDFRMYDTVLSAEEIQALAIPEPASVSLVLLGMGLMMPRRRRRAH